MGLLDMSWKNFSWKRLLIIVALYLAVVGVCLLILPSFGGLIDGMIHVTTFIIVVNVIDYFVAKRKRKKKN